MNGWVIQHTYYWDWKRLCLQNPLGERWNSLKAHLRTKTWHKTDEIGRANIITQNFQNRNSFQNVSETKLLYTHTHTINQSLSLCAKQCKKKKKYWVEDLVLDPGPVSFHKWPKNTYSCTDSCVGCSLCADRKQEIATSQIQSNLPHPTTSYNYVQPHTKKPKKRKRIKEKHYWKLGSLFWKKLFHECQGFFVFWFCNVAKLAIIHKMD